MFNFKFVLILGFLSQDSTDGDSTSILGCHSWIAFIN